MRQVKPTRVQKVMIALMSGAIGLLALWLIPELAGVLSPEAEDTFSEWVWDLPLAAVIAISLLFVVIGVTFTWAAGHFIEGWRARRGEEHD